MTGSMRRASQATKTFNDAQTTNIALSRNFRTGIQMAGYQVQDFAVQVAGGQSALVAFSQQGSQMLGIFGAGGAIAGAILSVGVLAARMMDVGDEAKKAKEEVDELVKSLEKLYAGRRDDWLASASPGQIVQSIGNELKVTLNAIDVMQNKLEKFQRRMANAKTFGGSGNENAQMILPNGMNQDDLAAMYGQDWSSKFDWHAAGGRWMDEGDAFDAYAKIVEETQTRLNVLFDKEREQRNQITAAVRKGYKEQMAGLDELMAKEGEQFDALVSGQKKANDEYEQGAKQSAAMAKQEEARIQRLVEGYRQLADPFLKFRDQIAEIQELQAKGRLTSEEAAGAIAKIDDAIQKLSDSIADSELKNFFGELDEKSKRNQENMLRQTKHFADAMNGMFQDVSNRAGDAFADMLMTGENAFDGLVDVVVRSVIRIATQMAIINPILNTLFGGFGGFVPLPSFWGGAAGTAAAAPVAGARAEGGPVDGGRSYLVGERGPELFTPGSSGSITSNGRLRAMSTTGGGNTYIINAPGATEQTVQRIQQALIQLAGPGVVERRAMTAMADSRRRGGLALA